MWENKRIYIIDDDDIFVVLSKINLERLGYNGKVTFFENGADATEQIAIDLKTGNLPDLILLDLNMPIVDGWQFLEYYQQLTPMPNTPIYMLSSSIDPLDIEKAKQYKSVVDFVSKPIQLAHLNQIINTLIV